MDEKQIIDKLKTMLTPHRFKHSIGVKETAIKLAETHGCNIQKAAIAGLLHDCAKDFTKHQMLQLCSEFDIVLDNICKKEIPLIHGFLSACIAGKYFNIEDGETLQAIRYHTLAKEKMSTLEKVIYIADFIEPNRCFEGVDAIRIAAYEDLNHAVLLAIDNTIKHVIAKGNLIHPMTIAARNYILLTEQSCVAGVVK